MSNVLEFYIKMKDMMSSGLSKLTANAQSSFSKIQNHINHASRSFDNFQQKAKAAGSSMGSFFKQLLSIGAGFGIGTAIYNLAGKFGDFVGKTIHVGIERAMTRDLKANALLKTFKSVQQEGHLTSRSLEAFKSAGFNPLKEISSMSGISTGQLNKKMRDGAITTGMVEAALKNARPGFQYVDENGPATIDRLKTSFGELQATIGERLTPTTFKASIALTKMFNNARDLIKIPTSVVLGEQINKIRTLQTELTSSNTKHERQLTLLQELEQINPKITENIDKQKISYSQLAENINNVTTALQNKIFLENFDKSNVRTITSYAEAQQKVMETHAASINVVAQAAPDIAQRTDLTLGQKQALTMKRLKGIVSNQPNQGVIGSGIGTTATKELEWRNQMIQAAKGNSEAIGILTKLQPQINTINKTKDALSKQINKYITPENIVDKTVFEGLGGKGGKKTKSEGSAASGITGGGPRVVNISGVKFMDKLADKLSINNQGDMDMVQQKFEEMFLRILNSGASVQ